MRTRPGSIRDLLQQVAMLSLPYNLRPFNTRWRFRRASHEKAIDQLIDELRGTADDLEYALHGETDDQK